MNVGAVGRMTNIIRLHPFECNFSNEHRHEHERGLTLMILLIRTLFPVLILLFYVLMFALWRLGLKRRGDRSTEDGVIPHVQFIFFFGFFTYVIDIAGELLRVVSFAKLPEKLTDHEFNQYDLLNDSFIWSEDSSIKYMEGPHLWVSILSLALLLCCLIVLAYSASIIYRGKQQELLEDVDFVHKYGFLCSGLRSTGLALYWNIFVAMRTITLSFVIIVFSPINVTTNIRLGLVFIVIFVSCLIHVFIKPFDAEDIHKTLPSCMGSTLRWLGAGQLAPIWIWLNKKIGYNSMEATSLLMALFVYAIATFITDEEASMLSIICAILNFVFMGFLFCRLWLGVHRILDVYAKVLKIRFQGIHDLEENEDTWLVHKLWVIWQSGRADRDTSGFWKLRSELVSLNDASNA